MLSRTVSTTLATGYVHAQVDDVEARDVEHGDDDVLADVVDVALHRAHDHRAELLSGDSAFRYGFSFAVMPCMISPAMMSSGMNASPSANRWPIDVHGLPAGGDDLERVGASLQLLVRDPQRVVLAQLDHGFLESA